MSPDLAQDVAKRSEITKRSGDTAGSMYAFLHDLQPQIKRALPRHLSADRLTRIVLTDVRRTPLLAKCTRESFAGALLTCAQLGLEPGVGGEAWLLPFRNGKSGEYEVNLIIGYAGMCKLFWQHPLAQSLDAGVVRARDDFDYAKGTAPFLRHKPAHGDRGAPVAYYAVATLTTGGSHFVVMSPDDVDAIRRRAKAKDDGPWKTDYDAMAAKTCLRQLFKLLPKSSEMGAALDAEDGMYHADVDVDVVPDEPAVDPDTGEVTSSDTEASA